MRAPLAATLGLSLVAPLGLVLGLRAGVLPTGVPGEWQWQRIPFPPSPLDVLLAGAGVVAYATFAAAGWASLRGSPGRRREAVWVAALVMAAVAAQIVAQSGGPVGHGLAKWSALGNRGASGYMEVARRQMDKPWRFWAEFPRWIRDQDALHIGTHPPGLFLASRGLLGLMDSYPGAAVRVASLLPETSGRDFRALTAGAPPTERAAAILMGALTLMASAATVAPLYALARATLPAGAAWSAAVLWPLAPAAVLFQPAADTAFPFLSTLALALVVGGGMARAIGAGVVLAVGMQLSLVFLPVGLAAGIVLATRPDLSRRGMLWHIAGTGAGFLGLTLGIWALSGADPFLIWWWNRANHARFYVENRRSYAAWAVAGPIELLVAVGLPAAIFAAVGFGLGGAPRASYATLAVLVLLDLSGKNLGEVGRLWLPFMPALLAASGAGVSRLRGGAWSILALTTLGGLQTLGLQAIIQVVYPV